ncbi:hypothetical protein INT47_012911 [Mucor saturninus]|uniref:Conserved oligomeric Golgi complex subunit 7 n=1 Tax=Mucor saturninus TaxID=64648 RepID=A0A8H7QQ17_9FUNG|nr:hypothetical protein INT47_012911 [Mucor saturninus]
MSMTVDIKDFSSPQFNAKEWINSVLKPTISINEEDDGGAKDTTILVTKLQMLSESASRQFDQQSTAVIKSMPRILYDLKVISDNATSTHQGVEAVKKNLGLIEGEAALDKLRKPHIAKTRMEQCRALLMEKAEELEQQQKEREALEALMRQAEEKKKQEMAVPVVEQEVEQVKAVDEQKDQLEKEKVVVEEKKALDEGLEYGHVQLPPLRAPTPRRVPTPVNAPPPPQEDNGYLQQTSNVFKKIGVPVSH